MKSKIIILLIVCALLIAGYSNKKDTRDISTIEQNAIQEIGTLVFNQSFSEAKAVLEFAEEQIRKPIEGVEGMIDSLMLAEEAYKKEDYTQASIHIEKAIEVAKGDNMIKGVYTLKEKIIKAQNVAENNISNEENVGGIISMPISWDIATASSYLPHKSKNYQAPSAIDENPSTAWIESGNDEDGIGEYLELKSNNTVRIDKISMTNGFAYDEKTYIRNNRIENAKIVFYDESGQEVDTKNYNFEDNNLDMVDIDFQGGIQASSIRIYIESVYTKDRKDKDTCISDLVVYGEVLN